MAFAPGNGGRRRSHGQSHSENDWAWVCNQLTHGNDASKLTRELASRRSDKPNPLYYAQRTVDIASARLWLLEGIPIDDVIKDIEAALFNPISGRLDAARIAKEMGVPVATIAGAVGRKAPGVRKSPDASSLQQSLRRLYRIWMTLVDLYAGDRLHARVFLNAPNRNLENRAPIEFIEHGDLTPLEMYVSAMSARQPA